MVLHSLFFEVINIEEAINRAVAWNKLGYVIFHILLKFGRQIAQSHLPLFVVPGDDFRTRSLLRSFANPGSDSVVACTGGDNRLEVLEINLGELQPHLREADIVISSTGAPHPILTKADVAEAIKERHNRPLFLIDIAVPRDIDPEVNKLSNVFLYDIDDLAEVVGSNLKMREKAAQQAEKIVNREVELTLGSVEARSRGSEIADLRKTLDKIGHEELLKAGNRMTSLSEQDRKILELMVHRIVNKISHPLVMEMKQSPESSPSLGQRLLSFFQTVTS